MTNQWHACRQTNEWVFLAVIVLLLAPFAGDKMRISAAEGKPELDQWVIFGKGGSRSDSPAFTGGRILAVFGKNEVDLTEATIPGETAVIHASALFGQVRIKVPRDWPVRVKGTAVLGKYTDGASSASAPGWSEGGRLIVDGYAVFGDVTLTR